MLKPLTQSDIVMNETQKEFRNNITDVAIPGIEVLHQRPTAEIAEVLAAVLKSRPNIIKMEYVVGSHIRLTTD